MNTGLPVELIAYGVRKGIERDLSLKVSLTYPPSAKAMGTDHGYVSVIALSQRVTIDYKELVKNVAIKGDSGISIRNPGKIYIYYRNKITKALEEPILSSIEIGVFDNRSFATIEKFHVDCMDPVDIVHKVVTIIKFTVGV